MKYCILLLSMVALCLARVQRVRRLKNIKARTKADDFDKVYQQFLDDENFQVNEGQFYSIFSKMGLSLGETKYIFNLIDIDKDKNVNIAEYTNFMEVFLKPFQACDPESTYQLDKDMIMNEECKFMVFDTPEDEPQLHIDVKNSTEPIIMYLGFGPSINFFGYIVVRKLIMGFQKCGDGRTLSRAQMRCAFKVLSKKRMITDADGYAAFDLVTYMQQGIKLGNNQLLGFREYLQVASVWLVFNEFGFIRNDDKMHVRELYQSIDEQKLPSYLDRKSVAIIFDEESQIGFSKFGVGFILNRIFNYYDKDMNQALSKEEWLKLLEDEQVNQWIKHWIDSLKEVPQDQIDAQDQKQDQVKYTEQDYLAYARLNKATHHHHTDPHHHKHKHTHHHRHHTKKLKKHKQDEEVQPNEPMRSLVWEMFRTSPNEEFRLENFYNFYRVGYKFIMEDGDFNGRLALPEIKHMYTTDTKSGHLQLKSSQIEILFQIVQFFKELQFGTIDIKQFFTFFTMRDVLGKHSVASMQNIFMGKDQITKIGEERFMLKFTNDMFVAAKIINFSKDGSKVDKDEQLFDGIIAFKAAIKYEVQAKKVMKIKGEARLKKSKNKKKSKQMRRLRRAGRI